MSHSFLSPVARGFTLVEVLVVLSIMSVLGGLTFVGLGAVANGYALSGAHRQVLSLLEEARAHSLASTNDHAHGVHFGTGVVTIFAGDTYDSADPNNRVVTLSGRASLSSVSLAGGGSSVVFGRASGRTAQHGTVTIAQASDNTKTRTITIAPSGVIE
jgi:prepilin-type N-terminal cleavage/methylation domain-containing protein